MRLDQVPYNYIELIIMNKNKSWSICLIFLIIFTSGNHSDTFAISSGGNINTDKTKESFSRDRVTAFRVRSDFNADLDENHGWGAPINEAPSQTVDTPFRIRFEVESDKTTNRRQYSLQYRRNNGPWLYMEAHEFPYPSVATPPMSIVGCEGFFYGEQADDLISVSKLPDDPGAGICLAPTTPGWIPGSKSGASAEWEWAVVVRHWTDGPGLVNEGDRFALRMVDQNGLPLPGSMPEFRIHVPARHLGGTFVETPARIGPYENNRGELYFIMEPTETDNCFMMLKSTNNGDSWFEIDPDNRPHAHDLEGVGSIMSTDGIIHIVHQTSHTVYYHAFATSDNPELSDRWIADSYVIAHPEKPPVQTADITIRPDGSLVVVYGSGTSLQFNIREPNGIWGAATSLDPENPYGLTNPSIVCRPNGIVDIAYKSNDGKGWCRQLMPNNSLTDQQMFADDLGTTEHESMAILPLIHLPDSGITAAFFRESNGYLYCSYKSQKNNWSKPIRVSDRPIVTNAVDSDQAGADVVAFGNHIYVAYIAEENQDIYLSELCDFQHTPVVTRIIPDIKGSWVRGQILYHQPNAPSYGFIYDAGSEGGSGYNRFFSYDLKPE